ncbi:MAG: hypothetical protein ATN31_05905 [Candidatus Epulonipiscioides saccharophilum]|nr:MAG: hypothetical protein ATN31_05905 [Epulopiscium sp. AS2M-Bin001]
MFCKLITYTLKGLEPVRIDVEVDINRGDAKFDIVGLPDNSIKESKDRMRAAVRNIGYSFPASKITMNLAPASLKKEGGLYDLAMTIAIMSVSRLINIAESQKYIYFGELALDGTLRTTNQLFPIMCALRNSPDLDAYHYIVPLTAKKQLDFLSTDKILYAQNLEHVVGFLKGQKNLIKSEPNNTVIQKANSNLDFNEIYGQELAKEALIVAAAGHHNILLIGPPGSGKTLMSKSFPDLFPPLNFHEIVTLTQLYSIAGLLYDNEIITTRPFRDPHHTITAQALCGGGQDPKPGDISLAHLGILFLDELLEFNKKTLEILRQPMEAKEITISRTKSSVTYPADFLLIASTNPCPCGYYPDRDRCKCSLNAVKKYLSKLSGPMLDRIDIHIETEPINFETLSCNSDEHMSTAQMLEKINIALERQKLRFKDKSNYFNAHMNNRELKEFCNLNPTVNNMLNLWMKSTPSSMRNYHKVLKMARTIADVNDSDEINEEHMVQAIQYRTLDDSFYV